MINCHDCETQWSIDSLRERDWFCPFCCIDTIIDIGTRMLSRKRNIAALVIAKAMEKYWYEDIDEEGRSRFCKFSMRT